MGLQVHPQNLFYFQTLHIFLKMIQLCVLYDYVLARTVKSALLQYLIVRLLIYESPDVYNFLSQRHKLCISCIPTQFILFKCSTIYVDTRKNGKCKTAFPHLVSCFYTSKCILHKDICITCILTYLQLREYQKDLIYRLHHRLSKFDRSVFLILKPIYYFFGIYMAWFFYLETFGVPQI